MPIALIIVSGESHLYLKGSLKTLPIIVHKLSCFNQKARNQVEFWHPMACIPNLGYRDRVLTKESRKVVKTMGGSAHNCQDEHNCLKAVLAPLVGTFKQEGICVTVR